jgi:hypothetical protein
MSQSVVVKEITSYYENTNLIQKNVLWQDHIYTVCRITEVTILTF